MTILLDQKTITLADCLPNRFSIGDKIGGGSQATIYRICDGKNCNFVARIEKLTFLGATRASFERVAEIYKIMASLNVGPGILGSWICDGSDEKGVAVTFGLLIMDELDGTLQRLLDEKWPPTKDEGRKNFDDIRSLVKKMHDAGYSHNDLHKENVMYKDTDHGMKWFLVDFGDTKRDHHYASDNRFLSNLERRLT